MKQYINKASVMKEIERRIKKYATIDVGNCKELEAIYGAKCKALTEIFSFLDTIEVKEVDLEKEFDNYAKNILACDVQFEPFTHLYNCAKYFYELGLNAKVVDANLWKSADGDDLPELEREVVVFTQEKGLSPKVCISHRPNPKGWDGTSISTGKTEHFQPMLYGKGGWSLPDVKWWLDCKLPFKEDEV